MRNRCYRLVKVLLILFVFGVVGLTTIHAQEDLPPPRLDITGAETDGFPVLRLKIISTDETSNRTSLPDGVQISENGVTISDFDVGSEAVGSEVIFVIDANRNINSRDDSSGLTRLDKVKESILSFASQYMNQSQLDQVTTIVPDGDQARFLFEDAVFPNEVINEINFYEPAQVGDTPLNEMMLMALDKAASTRAEGRFQTILLFSDAGPIGQQLDYETVVSRAQETNTPIFGAILGGAADNNEISNMQRLAQPTRGSFVHMPQPAELDPMFSLFQENGEQHVVEYRSQINSGGSHTIILETSDSQGSIDVELDLMPPAIEMALDNSAPIIRVAETHDAELSAANPTSQPVAARIVWPDGYPRGVVAASFIVNGTVEESVAEPSIGDDGLISFPWDISNLGDGIYNIVVSVTDELGLEGAAEPLPVTISVDFPEPPPPATAEPSQPVEEESAPESPVESDGLLDNLGALGIILAIFAMIFAVALVIFAIVLVRRRQTPAQPTASTAGAPVAAPSAGLDHDATQVIMPAFIAKQTAGAYIEPLDNAPDHQENIPLSGKNVTIGRDPKLVEILFEDKSVSRLHARIIQQGSSFQLYDEGSASGTYLNYEQLTLEPQPLRDNDDVHIGRVHLRFRLAGAPADDDSTQVMQAPPIRRGEGAQAAATAPPVDEDTSTQPYMPHSPQDAPQPQTSEPPDDEDADDISTQPYMPHSPKK
jgi:hypothetical protein